MADYEQRSLRYGPNTAAAQEGRCKLERYNPNDLNLTISGLARMGHKPSDEWFDEFLKVLNHSLKLQVPVANTVTHLPKQR